MRLSSVVTAALAAAVAIGGFAGVSAAADLPEYPVYIDTPDPLPLPSVGGWYLRGDIGYKIYSNPSAKLNDPTAGSVSPNIFYDEDMEDTYMVGVGAGYKVNDYFRADLTLDYEGAARFTGKSPCAAPCALTYTNEGADVEAWTALVNGYIDLGTYSGLTPYVGAGVGASYLMTSDGRSSDGSTYSGDNTWNFAWALMAGASYAMTEQLSLDVGYRYLDLGDAKTGLIGTTPNTHIDIEDITAHEIRVGLRYNLY